MPLTSVKRDAAKCPDCDNQLIAAHRPEPSPSKPTGVRLGAPAAPVRTLPVWRCPQCNRDLPRFR
jgi:hypothetical protein